MKRPPSAIHCLYKAPGLTSASLVTDFRAAHSGNWALKVSHGGVLDPFAEGLVLLLAGAANKLFEALHEAPKTYRATLEFGSETDTGDAGGQQTASGPVPPPAAIDALLPRLTGWHEQTPPSTSNKRLGGERAYVRAHRGETFTLPAQRVYCHEVRRLSEDTFELVVRGGFYVRAFAVALGRLAGCGAHVTKLERTAIGPYTVKTPPATGAAVLPWLPSLTLTDAEVGVLRRTGRLPSRALTPPPWPLPPGFPLPAAGPRVFHQGRLVALGATLLPGGV